MIDIYLINAIALIITIFLYNRNTYKLKLTNNCEINLSHAFFFSFWVVLLFLEYGFRGNFTADYENYRTWFNHAHGWTLDYILKTPNIEKGFLFLYYLVAQFSSEYYVMTLTMGGLTIGAYFTAIKQNCKILWPPILVLVGTGIYYGGFNLSSQMLAGSLFAFSVKYIYERKPIKYFLIILLAVSVHKSAIFLFPIYFISYINITSANRSIIVALIIMSFLFITVFARSLSIFVSSFMYDDAYKSTIAQGTTIGFIIKIIATSAFVIWFKNMFLMENIKDKVIYLGTIFCCIVVIWSVQLSLIQRMTYYFIIFPMLAYSHIIEKYKGNKFFLGVIIVVFFTVMQYGWFGQTYFTFMYDYR